MLTKAAILAFATQCQSYIAPELVLNIAEVESSKNPLAIAVVGVDSVAQPKTEAEAVSSISSLEDQGFNYSVGLMQINKKNFDYVGMTAENAFNICKNINAGARIFSDCLERAQSESPNKSETELILDAASCYYTGDLVAGYSTHYVARFSENLVKLKIGESYNVNTIKEPYISNEPLVIEKWDVFSDFGNKEIIQNDQIW